MSYDPGFIKLTEVVSEDLHEVASEDVWVRVASIAGLQRRTVTIISSAQPGGLVDVEITLVRCNGVTYGVSETPEEVFKRLHGLRGAGI